MTKTRPAVVLSTEEYRVLGIDNHRCRPDIAVGLIASQVPGPLTPADCEVRDWTQAGLDLPSFFRLFPMTLPQREVRLIGRLSDSDWNSVRACFEFGLGCDTRA